MNGKQLAIFQDTGTAVIVSKPKRKATPKKRYSGGGLQQHMSLAKRYSDMSVKELQAHAEKRGIVLPKRGSKKEFIRVITAIPTYRFTTRQFLPLER